MTTAAAAVPSASAAQAISAWATEHHARETARYPSEHLVRFMAREYPHLTNRHLTRVLDLGCGSGANTWFLAREGYQAFAIDAAATAVERAQRRLRHEECVSVAVVTQGLATDLPYADKWFNCVVDICTLQHVPATEAARAISEAHRVLDPGGVMFSIWANEAHGPIADGVSPCNRISVEQARELFASFARREIGFSAFSFGASNEPVSHWLIVARKSLVGSSR